MNNTLIRLTTVILSILIKMNTLHKSHVRLNNELEAIKKHILDNSWYKLPIITNNHNESIWNILIIPDSSSIYNGGKFNLEIKFYSDYPFKPPHVKFTTKIYHPNVYDNGFPWLKILTDNWNPSYTIINVLESLNKLMIHPFHSDNFNAKSHIKDDEQYRSTVHEWIELYANN